MTPLLFIRHGPTDWNADRRLQGRTDVSLSVEGRNRVMTWQLPDDATAYRLVSSPLTRAVETATLLAGRPPQIDQNLIEMNYGNWEGERLPDLRERLGDVMARNEARGIDFEPDGGERPRDVQQRLEVFLKMVGEDAVPTIAVSHHGVLRALYAMASGWDMVQPLPEKFRWGAMHEFRVSETGAVDVERINVPLEAP